MTASTDIVRILATRHTQVPLLALLAMGVTSAHGESLHDPMRPANAAPAQTESQDLRLEAIFTNGGSRVAIVNGQLVRAGESVETAHIESITEDSVRYTRDGSSRTVRLPASALQVRSAMGKRP
jgi:hypothetical protein